MPSTTKSINLGSAATTVAPSATEQTKSIHTKDDHSYDTPWITYLRGELGKETEAANERGITVYKEAIDVGVAKLKEIDRLELETLDWKERYEIFTQDAQSGQ